MKEIIFLLIISAGAATCSRSQMPVDLTEAQTTVVEYTASDELFPNPERGFYKYSDCQLGSGSSLSEATLKQYRERSITLLFRYFYIKNFRNTPLSAQALAAFDSDMAIIRRGGAKCIVRFAYSSAANEPDAPLASIVQHIDQLKPLLEKNADVIAVVQAGFIGAWGEWYYSSNGLNNAGARHQVLTRLLDALPTSRMIQVRTPAYKQEFCQRNTPLTQDEAFSGQPVARIAHHNDCFLASATDYGTYVNVESDKNYLNRECLFVPIGGETCPPDGIEPATGLKAYDEMKRLRFSFLNEDYYQGVNNLWNAGGYMDKIKKEMGYRFVLITGEYTVDVAPGGMITARIILKNAGFASPYNERKVELILTHATTGERYMAPIDEDPRRWTPNVERTVEITAGLPPDMPVGQYILSLNLPDAAESLYDNADYSIRLANTDVWDEATGYNTLYDAINIDAANQSTPYTGTLFFSSSRQNTTNNDNHK
ncbi:MAG: DUF4832 domain-containing protein [Prevotellaceae bacterium]|jgi:hypothetical protein|nr:DUF4832 domain-containing protein [Prevotellaceae bacterium]